MTTTEKVMVCIGVIMAGVFLSVFLEWVGIEKWGARIISATIGGIVSGIVVARRPVRCGDEES